MNIHEDSIPLSYTPDGLDEAAIDALIEESSAHVPDEMLDEPTGTADPLPIYRASGKQSPNGQAA